MLTHRHFRIAGLRVWLLLALVSWPGEARADDWVEVTSPHFRVVTDQGTRNARRVANDLEQIIVNSQGRAHGARIRREARPPQPFAHKDLIGGVITKQVANQGPKPE